MSEKDFKDLEDMSHLQQLDSLLSARLKESIDPMKKAQQDFQKMVGVFVVLAAGVIGYIVNKYDKIDATYLQKWEYYRMEDTEHEKMKEAFANPVRAPYIMREITDNVVKELGFQFVPRGSVSAPKEEKK